MPPTEVVGFLGAVVVTTSSLTLFARLFTVLLAIKFLETIGLAETG
jgi:hypothetical protein